MILGYEGHSEVKGERNGSVLEGRDVLLKEAGREGRFIRRDTRTLTSISFIVACICQHNLHKITSFYV